MSISTMHLTACIPPSFAKFTKFSFPIRPASLAGGHE